MAEEADSAVDRLAFLRQELAPDLEVIRHLSTGRMAEVWLGRQNAMDRLVAVTILSRQSAGDATARARFHREAKAVASLDHPNAVEVYDSGFLSDGLPFLVLQYVSGGNLADRLAAEGPLPVPAARQILVEVADALAAAHAHGFVHRDIRPANVLCDPERDRVLLTGFGLAGLLPRRADPSPRLTREGEIIGTSGYLSPEQLEGKDATESTDIYALGLLGYEVLTGEGPFSAAGGLDMTLAHLRSPPRPVSALRPDVDEDLSDLLIRCLAKAPERRPSARYIVQALRGDSIVGPPEYSGPTAETFVGNLIRRRLPLVVAVTGLIGYAVLQFAGDLEDRGVLPEPSYKLTLNTFACALAASSVIAWFHGKKGKQRIRPLEAGLLAAVGIVWLLVGIWIILGTT